MEDLGEEFDKIDENGGGQVRISLRIMLIPGTYQHHQNNQDQVRISIRIMVIPGTYQYQNNGDTRYVSATSY